MLFTSNSSLLNPSDLTKSTFFLTFNDESINEVETLSVKVSNTPVFGKHFRVTPGASVQDGSPECPARNCLANNFNLESPQKDATENIVPVVQSPSMETNHQGNNLISVE